MLNLFEKSSAWDKVPSALSEEEREYTNNPSKYEIHNENGFDLEKLGSTQHQSKWVDVENKAKRIITSNGVALIHKRPYDLNVPLGIVEIKAKVRGYHGSYESTIHQPHPKSRAVRWWDCQCTWRRYVWDRRPIWITDKNGIRREINKKFEGRVCSHVLALWWYSAGVPVSYEDIPVAIMQRDFPELIGQDRLDGADWEKLQEINDEQENLRKRQNKPDSEGTIRDAEMVIADLEDELSQLDDNNHADRLKIMDIEKQIEIQRERIDRANNAESINKSIQGQLSNDDLQSVIDQIGSGRLFNALGDSEKIDIDDIGNRDGDVYEETLLAINQKIQDRLKSPEIIDIEKEKELKKLKRNKTILEVINILKKLKNDNKNQEEQVYIEEIAELRSKFIKARRKYELTSPKVKRIQDEINNRLEIIKDLYKNRSTFDYTWTQIDQSRDEVERQPNEKAKEPMPQIDINEELIPTTDFSKNQIEDALNFFRSNGMTEEAVDLRRAIEENDISTMQELFIQYNQQEIDKKGWVNLFDQEDSKKSSVSFISSDQSIKDIIVYLQKEIANNQNPRGYVRKEMWGEQRGGLHPHPDALPVRIRPDGNFTYSIDDLGYHPENGEMGHNLEERGTYGSVPVGEEVSILSVDPKNRLVMIEYDLQNNSPNHQHIRIWIPLKDIDLV